MRRWRGGRHGNHGGRFDACRTTGRLEETLFTGLLAAGWLSVAGVSTIASASGGVDPFHALLRPESSQQDVGSDFELTFEVDDTARRFNGYEIQLHWDPAVLSLSSIREGSLMSQACANNFTNLAFTDSTATYSHVLLCGGVSLDGPGVLSVFTFHGHVAGGTTVDLVSDPNRTFFDDGIFISPAHPTYPRQVQLSNATVFVGTSSGIESNAPDRASFEIRVVPNPVVQDAMLQLRFDDSMREARSREARILLEIADVSGRRIARWEIDFSVARGVDVPWRPIDGNGAPLPAGPYFYRGQIGHERVAGKVLVIR